MTFKEEMIKLYEEKGKALYEEKVKKAIESSKISLANGIKMGNSKYYFYVSEGCLNEVLDYFRQEKFKIINERHTGETGEIYFTNHIDLTRLSGTDDIPF